VANQSQQLSSAATFGDMALSIDVVQGQRYYLKAAPSYADTSLLGNVYTISARLAESHPLTLSTLRWNAPSAGGSLAVTVSGGSGTWTAVTASGLVQVSPTQGSLGQSMTLKIGANLMPWGVSDAVTVTSSDGRTATLPVIQAKAADPAITLNGTPTLKRGSQAWTVPADWPLWTGQRWTAEAQPTSLCGLRVQTNQSSWTASSSAGWLHVTPSAGATGAQVCLTTDVNASGASRQGTVIWQSNGASFTVSVTQSAQAALIVSPTAVTFNAGGGQRTIQVTTLGDAWLAVPSVVSWVRLEHPAGTGPGSFVIVVDPGSARTTQVTVSAAGMSLIIPIEQTDQPTPTASPSSSRPPTTSSRPSASPTASAVPTSSPSASITIPDIQQVLRQLQDFLKRLIALISNLSVLTSFG